MTLEDALKTFPPAKQQVRAGIANLGPGFTMVETGVQSVENNSSDDSSEYSSEEFSDSSDESESDKETRKHVQKKIEAIQKKDKNYKTSAYLDVLVQSVIGRGIADTGAGKTVISEAFMNRLGWSIDKPTKIAFTVATGEKATALGIIKNIPITVGGLTIPISAIVSTSTTYDILLGNDWLIKANAVIDLTNTKLTISAHNQEVSVNINLDSGAQYTRKKSTQKRNFEINQFDFDLPVDDWCPFDDEELSNPWWQEETEQDYQSSIDSFERIELPELPGWETEPHPWETAGAVDNTEWLKQETPSSSHLKPIKFSDEDLCPSTRRLSDNLKKGRCPHGLRFYHAESTCFSCSLETAALDQEFWNKKLAQEEDRSEPESDSTSEPWIDTCAHDVPIDDYHWCQDCENYSEACKNADEIAPEYPVLYNWVERKQERERQEMLDLKNQRKLEAIQDGKKKACNHRHRNSQGCWNCDAEQATIQENLRRQQRKTIEPETPKVLTVEEIYQGLFNPESIRAWREKVGLPSENVDKKPKNHPRRYSTTVEDADLDLQDFGIKPKQASRKMKEQSDLEEFFDIGRLQPRPRENLHEDYNWRLNPSQKKNRVFKQPRISRAIQTNLVQILQEDLSEDEETKAEITVKKMCEDSEIIIPKKKHNADAGYDLQSRDTTKIPPGGMMLMRTGLSFGIPEGYFGLIKARRSLAIAGLSVEGGVIDSGYDGEIIVIIVNRNLDRPFIVQAYDRIAQMVPIAILTSPLVQVKEHNRHSTRKAQGFGSTGVNAVHPKKITEYNDGKGQESKFAYNFGPKLVQQQRDEINRIMHKYQSILATSFEDIKGSDLHHQHTINTGNHRPIKRNPYPMSSHKKGWVEREVAEMLESGIVSRSKSPWSFPIVVVAKKTVDGKSAPRLCVNFQPLNEITVKDAYPIPRVMEILEQMQGDPNYYTSLDLFSGFHQIGLDKDASQKCAFSTSQGHYQYNRMPFGLCNAPATFQRVMNEIFHDMIGKKMHVYIDDVTIYSKTFRDHMDTLEEVMRRIQKHGMFLKPKKCTIATHELHMLGHIISQDGIKTDPAKISAVSDYPTPTSKTEVRAFMGLAGYYRHFIPNCSKIAEPINRTLKKDIPFKWTDEAQSAFDQLKEKLCSAPILARPSFKRVFKLHTDACRTGLGAVLTQDFPVYGKYDRKGKQVHRERVISYASRSLQGAPQNYGATQLEQLAVVWAVEHYRQFLEGRPFRVITDHTALKSLMKMENPPALYARWIISSSHMTLMLYTRKADFMETQMLCHAVPITIKTNPPKRSPS